MQEVLIDEIEEHGTQTHYSDEGAREMVLIGMPYENVGTDNMYPPPSPYDSNLGLQMRGGYFFHNGTLIVQFPRRADDINSVNKKLELTDICVEDGEIFAYYPVNEGRALRLTWNYVEDEWSLQTLEFDEFSSQIESKHQKVIWQNRSTI